jgi:hypothetical protein
MLHDRLVQLLLELFGLGEATLQCTRLQMVSAEMEAQPRQCVVARLPTAASGQSEDGVVVLDVVPRPLLDARECRFHDRVLRQNQSLWKSEMDAVDGWRLRLASNLSPHTGRKGHE